jgi:hypothetical protein
VKQVTPGINPARISPHVKLLVAATVIACGMTARAFHLLQERCRPPY